MSIGPDVASLDSHCDESNRPDSAQGYLGIDVRQRSGRIHKPHHSVLQVDHLLRCSEVCGVPCPCTDPRRGETPLQFCPEVTSSNNTSLYFARKWETTVSDGELL